jgi:anti-anti-sigma factor
MMGASLNVTTHQAGDGTVQVTAVGELDMSTVGRFESALREALGEAAPGRTTTLDLRGVEYLDSAAINVLFAHAARIGRLRINPLLMRGLAISGVDQVIAVEPTATDGG